MSQHDLKVWPEYFEELWQGRKKFEIRKDDRGYQLDDYLVLREWNPETSSYSGRAYRARVDYIYRGDMVAPGHCVLSIRKLPDIR